METTTYKSAWGSPPWIAMAITAVSVLLPALLSESLSWTMVIIGVALILFELLAFCSILYKVVGDELWVYELFHISKYPIGKIAKVEPTKSILSAPALSISKRIAIKFTDKSIMKGSLPLIISPKDTDAFIKHLKKLNPTINS